MNMKSDTDQIIKRLPAPEPGLTAIAVAKINKPGLHRVSANLYFRVTGGNGRSWIFRYWQGGKAHEMGLGSVSLVSLAEARDKVFEYRRLLLGGGNPLEHRAAAVRQQLEQQIIEKSLAFIERGIEPACYLYRHYHPSGDLLYVGITLYALERQRRHLKAADWRHMICRIVVEPFATREEALAAEQMAIKTEFPRFNSTYNGQRHPIQELTQLSP
jgi:hypothetical protein